LDTTPTRKPGARRTQTLADTAAPLNPAAEENAAHAPSKAPRETAAPKRTKAEATKIKVVAQVVGIKKPASRTAKSKVAPPSIDRLVRDAVLARLDAMKANDLKVIDVRGKTSITDCLVIVSGTSTRHVKALGGEVVVTAKKLGMMPIGIEGERDAEWMLVDLGDTVIHVMLPRVREFYALERLWSLAQEPIAAVA